MSFPYPRSLAVVLAAIFVSSNAASAEAADSDGLISPTDPRFNVFELSNSAGDGTYASSVGTVVLSFLAEDSRYCRAARFPSDNRFVLACRDERGWKIEAENALAPAEASNPTAFGGGSSFDMTHAIVAMMARADPLDEREIIEAAAQGWRATASAYDQSLDARAILRGTARTYRASKSYVDTGTVQTVYVSLLRTRTAETHFKTAYVAPFDFRFESTMHDFENIAVNFIAWRSKEGVKSWLSVKPEIVEDIDSIERALDAGAGISRDSSGMIPGLIFPDMRLGGDIVKLADPVRLDDAQIDGFDCFQVQGTRWPHKGPTTVWIDKKTFLIRKVYEEDEIKGATTQTTWFYTPAINVPVNADSLQFAKPILP